MNIIKIEGDPRLEVRIPHIANIIQKGWFGLTKCRFDLEPLKGPIPRALQTLKRIGQVCIMEREVEVNEVTYGNTVDLPNFRKGVYQVVSPLTIAAAHREGRSTDDLLFPFSLIYKDGSIVGARGLAQAVFRPGTQIDPIEYSSMFKDIREVKNIGAAPVQLFDPSDKRQNGQFSIIEPGTQPRVFIPAAQGADERLSLVYKDGGLNRKLTAKLGGIPVFKPELVGVANIPPEPFDATLRMTSDPRVALALGRGAFQYGIAMHDMAARSPEGQVIGGTSILMVSRKNLIEPTF